MALSKDVEFAVETLIDLGVLNEEGLKRLGGLFQGLKVFSGAFNGGVIGREQRAPRKGYYAKSKPGVAEEAPHKPRAALEEEPENGSSQATEDHQVPDENPSEEDAPSSPTKRKRAPKGSFNPSKLELQNLRDGGMTIKQIAQLKGVSSATVNNKLREHGLTVPGRRGRLR